MCGRFTCAAPSEIVAEVFGLAEPVALAPRFNVAPTQPVAVVRWQEGGRYLSLVRWGLIPGWATDAGVGARLINARAETVAVKPAFRSAFKARRCLILADGFYEWARRGSGKQPYWIGFADGRPFAFAGLWERWQGSEGAVESCTIITTAANEVVAPLHDRMPVILPPASFAPWIDSNPHDAAALPPLLRPYPPEGMVAWPVSPRVNNPRHDDPACRAPVTPFR